MELHETEITGIVDARFAKKGEVLVAPLGDIQYGHMGCAISRLKAHIDWGCKNGVWWLGTGDYFDWSRPSIREALRILIAKDDTTEISTEFAADARLEGLTEILRRTKGHWLGMVGGHHLYEYPDGTTSDTRLAEALGAPFLGEGAATVNLRFGDRECDQCMIWVHHGYGSGRTIASPINKLRDMMAALPQCRAYIIGHYHRLAPVPQDSMWFKWGRKNTVQHRRKWLVVSGGFLRGYYSGGRKPSYIEQRMLPPTDIGGLALKITPHEDYIGIGVEVPPDEQ